MATTSVFVQAFGELPQEKMQSLVGMFYEQSSANMLLHMPRADFSVVHAAATQRFGQYAALIIDAVNSDTSGAMQDSSLSLMTVLDENLQVEREAFERSLAGLAVCSGLADYAIQVRDAAAGVRGEF